MKKSFAPKLTENEAAVLRTHNFEFQEATGFLDEQLACRGLLERDGRVRQELNQLPNEERIWERRYRALSMPYRLTPRGELMLQRYQKEQADRQWKEADAKDREASLS